MKSNVEVMPLSADQAIREWTVISGIMDKVLDYACGRYTMDHMKERVADGMALPMLIWNREDKHVYAVIVAEANIFPLKKVFTLSICGGEGLFEWCHVWPQIKDIARGMGYDQIEIMGRPGWKKFIHGAREITRCWVEELNDAGQGKNDR